MNTAQVSVQHTAQPGQPFLAAEPGKAGDECARWSLPLISVMRLGIESLKRYEKVRSKDSPMVVS